MKHVEVINDKELESIFEIDEEEITNEDEFELKGCYLRYGIFKPIKPFISLVLQDDLKYLIKNKKPSLNYNYFYDNGFKIKALSPATRNVKMSLDEILGEKIFEMLNADNTFGKRCNVQSDLMKKIKLITAKGRVNKGAWINTGLWVTKRYDFSDCLHVIENENDLITFQQALLNEKSLDWVYMNTLVLEHIETKREIVYHLNKTKGQRDKGNDQLYISFLENKKGEMSQIDNYQKNQIDFLFDGTIHEYYCEKSVKDKVARTIVCVKISV